MECLQQLRHWQAPARVPVPHKIRTVCYDMAVTFQSTIGVYRDLEKFVGGENSKDRLFLMSMHVEMMHTKLMEGFKSAGLEFLEIRKRQQRLSTTLQKPTEPNEGEEQGEWEDVTLEEFVGEQQEDEEIDGVQDEPTVGEFDTAVVYDSDEATDEPDPAEITVEQSVTNADKLIQESDNLPHEEDLSGDKLVVVIDCKCGDTPKETNVPLSFTEKLVVTRNTGKVELISRKAFLGKYKLRGRDCKMGCVALKTAEKASKPSKLTADMRRIANRNAINPDHVAGPSRAKLFSILHRLSLAEHGRL